MLFSQLSIQDLAPEWPIPYPWQGIPSPWPLPFLASHWLGPSLSWPLIGWVPAPEPVWPEPAPPRRRSWRRSVGRQDGQAEDGERQGRGEGAEERCQRQGEDEDAGAEQGIRQAQADPALGPARY